MQNGPFVCSVNTLHLLLHVADAVGVNVRAVPLNVTILRMTTVNDDRGGGDGGVIQFWEFENLKRFGKQFSNNLSSFSVAFVSPIPRRKIIRIEGEKDRERHTQPVKRCNHVRVWGAAVAQWICLHLPSCHPGL